MCIILAILWKTSEAFGKLLEASQEQHVQFGEQTLGGGLWPAETAEVPITLSTAAVTKEFPLSRAAKRAKMGEDRRVGAVEMTLSL